MIGNVIQVVILSLVVLLSLRKKNTMQGEFAFSRDYTNVLRAFAILLVMMHHVSNFYDCKYFTPLGGIGVSIFLIVSGFGLNESYKHKGFSSFWGNKIVRVILPCWIVISLASLIKIENFNLYNFIKSLLCVDVNWYVRYLFYWYTIFYFTTKYLANQRLLIFSLIAGFMLIFLPEIEAEQSFSFLLGVFISCKTYRGKSLLFYIEKLKILFLILGILALLFKQSVFVRSFEGTAYFNIVQLTMKLSLGLFFVALIQLIYSRYYSVVINYIGKISYELYLTHCAFLFLLHSFDNSIWSIMLFYAISVLSAIVLYNIDTLISKKYKKLCQNS